VRRAGQVLVAVAVAGALLFVIGVLNPSRPRPVTTDQLGPENGERVAAYVARADENAHAATGSEPRWGLVSFDSAVGIDAVRDISRSVRVSRVLFQVPLDRVQTPVVSVAVGASDAALERAGEFAAVQVGQIGATNERAQKILGVSSARLARGCDCVVGVLARADPAALFGLGQTPDVRVVEVLDTDVPYGQFAVRPLLPAHRDIVGPGPDDGQVPDR